MRGRAWEPPRITLGFQIYLAPPSAGPQYHHSGWKRWVRASSRLDGSTKCSMAAFILCHPICQAQQWDPCSTDNTEPPTRDPTWERGAQTLKGTLRGSYSTTKGGCEAENQAHARCTTRADENWARHHVQARHQNPPKKIGEILRGLYDGGPISPDRVGPPSRRKGVSTSLDGYPNI